MTQEKLNIYQKINNVMKEVDYIQKGDKKVNNQYNFVSHDQVTAKMHPALTKHGIVVIPSVDKLIQDGNRTSVELSVKFVNVDDPHDSFTMMSCGFGIDAGDKGPGKAISYAFKYAMLKVFCLETGDDPDQDQYVIYEPDLPEDKDEIAKKGANFLKNYSEEMHPQIKEYLRQYTIKWNGGKYLKTFEQYQNSEKFLKDFEKWRANISKTAMKAA
jgi:thiol-disulfide isomerase/thioredoxin